MLDPTGDPEKAAAASARSSASPCWCPKCRYDLRGVPASPAPKTGELVCPECGWQGTPDQALGGWRMEKAQRSVTRIALAPIPITLLCFAAACGTSALSLMVVCPLAYASCGVATLVIRKRYGLGLSVWPVMSVASIWVFGVAMVWSIVLAVRRSYSPIPSAPTGFDSMLQSVAFAGLALMFLAPIMDARSVRRALREFGG